MSSYVSIVALKAQINRNFKLIKASGPVEIHILFLLSKLTQKSYDYTI